MKKLEERIARLERKRGGSEPPPFVPVMIFDGQTVTACMAPPAGVIRDLGTFYERQEWRDWETCQDTGICKHAEYCRASRNRS